MRGAIGATIDRPPPPGADLEEGDGEESYDIRFVTNEEREQYVNLWLPIAGEEERRLLQDEVLPFRSTKAFTGKSRLCVGAFLGEQCVGLATTEVVPDFSNLGAFFMQSRILRCITLVLRPRSLGPTGSLLVQAIKQLGDESGYRVDFDSLQKIAGGKYWVLARSL